MTKQTFRRASNQGDKQDYNKSRDLHLDRAVSGSPSQLASCHSE